MKEIGQKLKAAREEKGYSLNEVSELTKIRSLYLQAIEDGDMERIPGTVYAKGFIKAYATAVDLDPNEILAGYQSYLEQLPPEEPQDLPEITIIKPKSAIPVGKIVVLLLVVVLVGGGVFFVKNLWTTIQNETIPQLLEPDSKDETEQQSPQDLEPTADQNQTQTEEQSATSDLEQVTNSNSEVTTTKGTGSDTTAVETDKSDSATTTETDESLVEEVKQPADEKQVAPKDHSGTVATSPQKSETTQKQSTTTEPIVKKEEPVQPVERTETSSAEKTSSQKVEEESLQFQIIAVDLSWVRVQVDGKTVFQGELEKDESRLFEGHKMSLRMSNGEAIRVNFKGILLGPFGSKDDGIVEKVFGE